MLAGTQKSSRGSQLHFLWRLEPALRCALVRDHRDGFLAWPSNEQGQRSTCKTSLAGCERLHESEDAGVFQIRKLSVPKFSVAARASGDHLSTAASGHFASGRNFLLHSIHFRTPSTFIGLCCDQRNLCGISFSPFPFFRSWWPVQSCAPVTFSPASPSSAFKKRPIS